MIIGTDNMKKRTKKEIFPIEEGKTKYVKLKHHCTSAYRSKR